MPRCTSGYCINKNNVYCDGIEDCWNGEDEAKCGRLAYKITRVAFHFPNHGEGKFHIEMGFPLIHCDFNRAPLPTQPKFIVNSRQATHVGISAALPTNSSGPWISLHCVTDTGCSAYHVHASPPSSTLFTQILLMIWSHTIPGPSAHHVYASHQPPIYLI